MAPRAHWKGYLKLSLVSCPIALYPAISAAKRVSFRQINRQSGNRLRQQMVDSVTGEVVQSHDKGRGYELGERQLLLVEDQELEAAQQEARRRPYSAARAAKPTPQTEEPVRSRGVPVRPHDTNLLASREEARRVESKRPAARPDEPEEAAPRPPPVRVENNRTIEIERFVPLEQIDPRYHDTPYYIAPRDDVGQEAFAVIREAMGSEEMVGMGRVVLAKRERPIILRSLDKGLLGMTLRYAHEVRNEAEYFAGIPELELPEEMLQAAQHILEMKRADFDPAYLEDRYRTALVSMLRQKQGELPEKVLPAALSPQNVVNLMDALKRSLQTEQPGTRVRKPTSPRPAAAASKPPAKRTTPSRTTS